MPDDEVQQKELNSHHLRLTISNSYDKTLLNVATSISTVELSQTMNTFQQQQTGRLL